MTTRAAAGRRQVITCSFAAWPRLAGLEPDPQTASVIDWLFA